MYTDNQVSADWEIRKVSDNSLVYESPNDTTNLITLQVPGGVLATDTQYKWRVRYKGEKYGFSDWSDYRNFTTGNQFDVEILSIYRGASSDYFYGVTIDSSGNIYAVGYTSSEGQGSEALIVKYDSNLNKVASKIYGGAGSDYFYGATIDSSGNIYAVGYTSSEGQGSTDALIVKYDTNLNKVAAKIYGGAGGDQFRGVTVDSSGNVYAVGYTISEGQGSYDALIVKYDTNLNKVAAKIYGGAGSDGFYGVTVDSSGNVYAVGYTISEGQGSNEALIVKYDSNLNKVAAKIYGGAGSEYFYGVTVDSSGNVYAVGYTSSEGQGSNEALIVKYDSNLNKVAAKIYGGAGSEYFYGVTVDSSGNVYAVGYTSSEGQGSNEALIVKYDSNLNKVAAKIYGGADNDYFNGAITDSSGNVYAVGYTSSEGQGSNDAIIVKYDSNLNKVAAKIYGGASSDYFRGVTTDSSGNIYAVGYAASQSGGTSYEAWIVKTSLATTGTFPTLNYVTLADSALTEGVSSLTDAPSSLTAANSSLTDTTSNLTVGASTLTSITDSLL